MNEQQIITKIEKMIYVIRGQTVMLDADLANLYEVELKRLLEQVRRNQERFPDDFMFQLTTVETIGLRSQFATFKSSVGSRKYQPYVFTENGVAMLSSVLNGPKAIQVNISIMRIFTKMRNFLLLDVRLNKRIDDLERDTTNMFRIVFEKLDRFEEMVNPTLPANRKRIGISKNNK